MDLIFYTNVAHNPFGYYNDSYKQTVLRILRQAVPFPKIGEVNDGAMQLCSKRTEEELKKEEREIKDMRINCMYFSPTGGTKKVMEIFCEKMLAEQWIDLSIRDCDYTKYEFGENDICIIAVPSYGGRVPGIVLERMKQMKIQGAKAVIAAVYGNRAYDDTLLELKDECEVCGFEVIAALAAVAEHSIVRQYGAGRPDEEDRKELQEFAKRIQESLEDTYIEDNGQEINHKKDLKVPGNSSYREYNGVPLKPKGGHGCTKCGKCAAECPVGAIPEDKPDTVDEDKCISCMRCITVCPRHARKVNPALVLGIAEKLKKLCSGRKPNELFL